jgi:hypothetical protein
MSNITKLPYGFQASPLIGGGLDMFSSSFAGLGNIYFVDGDNGADGNNGLSPDSPKATIQSAVTAAAANAVDGGVVYIKARDMAAGASDPVSYAENVIIPASASRLSLIGVSGNRTQCGLPQIKVGGTVASALLTVRAPGCLIANIGFNGNSTAGAPLNVGILLDDDGSTKSACGTSIISCHFKNCTGSTVTNGKTGGAITWAATGGAWQVLIKDNRFYKNVCDICLLGTSVSVPQDVVIENNVFSGNAADVDGQLWLKGGGSGMLGLVLRSNVFPVVGAIGSGQIAKFGDLTGCTGIMEGNVFGTSTTLTFGAAGTAMFVPTTVFMPRNYRETTTGVSSEVFRT